MHSSDQFKDIYDNMEKARKSSTELSRYGIADRDGKVLRHQNYICYGMLPGMMRTAGLHFVYSCWYGDAPPGNILNNGGVDYPARRRAEYIPGPSSDKWLKFLLDPERSPWKDIHPFIVNNDFDTIRSSGFIIDVTSPKLSFALLYNFLIASRWAYEMSHKYKLFEELVDNGVDPRVAYLVGSGFMRKVEIKRTLLKEAGYRKDDKGRLYIKNEYGERKWFEAEYSEEPPVKHDVLTPTTYNAHEAVSFVAPAAHRILNCTPNVKGRDQALTGRRDGEAWDIWKSDGVRYDAPGYTALTGKPVEDAIKYIESLR